MLKKTGEIARAAGESLGVLAPSAQNATAAAEIARAALVAAQAARDAAEQELQAAHEQGASPKEIVRLEAALAATKQEADRAERAYIGAEKRLAAARDADGRKAKAAATAARDAALDRMAESAAEIDRLAALIAEQVRAYDAEIEPLSVAASAGVASRVFHCGGAVIVRHALEKAGALPSSWLGDRSEQPGAVQLAERERGAVVAGA